MWSVVLLILNCVVSPGTQVIEQLIENGGNVNIFDRSGITPLHYSGIPCTHKRLN